MALINTTTTGVLGSTFYGDGSGDLTIQQNGVTVNKLTAAPAFHASCGALTLAASTFTKMPFSSKVFDTNNNYDATTNYRFLPTVAGYYWIKVQYFLGVSTGRTVASIYKNGGDVCQTLVLSSNTNGGISVVSQGLISFNGTTDYVEAYGYQESAGTGAINTNAGLTFFQGYMVRAA
jgi:hypothetical protein